MYTVKPCGTVASKAGTLKEAQGRSDDFNGTRQTHRKLVRFPASNSSWSTNCSNLGCADGQSCWKMGPRKSSDAWRCFVDNGNYLFQSLPRTNSTFPHHLFADHDLLWFGSRLQYVSLVQ